MPFTANELASIANAAIDYHYRKQPFMQTIQDKPLLKAMLSKKKTFPGGKDNITIPVKGKIQFEAAAGSLTGYTHDDTVAYGTIAGIERVSYPWREMHTGWTITHTELKKDGISVVDSTTGKGTSEHSGREMTALSNILQDKLETFDEIKAKEMNALLWGDGTADAKGFLGIRAFIKPLTTWTGNTVGGLDQATLTWWRNRYRTLAIASNEIIPVFHQEFRQLRRYGGKPDLVLCGSDMLDQIIKELRAKGTYTDSGWTSSGSTNIAVADIKYNNISFVYDPSMDDLGGVYLKSAYMLDTRRLYIEAMEGEWEKQHTPARPETRYALYKAETYTGNLVANQLNCHGIVNFT
jgi:hypothetical protein